MFLAKFSFNFLREENVLHNRAVRGWKSIWTICDAEGAFAFIFDYAVLRQIITLDFYAAQGPSELFFNKLLMAGNCTLASTPFLLFYLSRSLAQASSHQLKCEFFSSGNQSLHLQLLSFDYSMVMAHELMAHVMSAAP